MIDPSAFATRQIELNVEFGKFIIEHPETLDALPDGAYVFFDVEGETAFNEFSKRQAEKKRGEGASVVRIRVKGLTLLQGSRLIDPVIEPLVEVA